MFCLTFHIITEGGVAVPYDFGGQGIAGGDWRLTIFEKKERKGAETQRF